MLRIECENRHWTESLYGSAQFSPDASVHWKDAIEDRQMPRKRPQHRNNEWAIGLGGIPSCFIALRVSHQCHPLDCALLGLRNTSGFIPSNVLSDNLLTSRYSMTVLCEIGNEKYVQEKREQSERVRAFLWLINFR
jgi:hypothetical protein